MLFQLHVVMEDNDLLSGWKEIASYLKTSPKNARRWEKYDNLPTLRPARGYHQSKAPVLAKKSALDQWLQGTLERVVLDGDRLVALGISEKIIWNYEFPAALRPLTPEDLIWRVRRADLQGNGSSGVLVTVRFLDSNVPDRMYYFSSEGNLQWELEALAPLLDRDGTPFEQAWTFKHVIVAATRAKSPYGLHLQMKLAGQAVYYALTEMENQLFSSQIPGMSNGSVMHRQQTEIASSFAARTIRSSKVLSPSFQLMLNLVVLLLDDIHDTSTRTHPLGSQ